MSNGYFQVKAFRRHQYDRSQAREAWHHQQRKLEERVPQRARWWQLLHCRVRVFPNRPKRQTQT